MASYSTLPAMPNHDVNIPNIVQFRAKYLDIIMRQCKPAETTRCLEWQGALNGLYSHISYSYRISPYKTLKKYTSAHRLLFALCTDSIYLLDKSYSYINVSHICHNPKCCNLEHLEAEPIDINNNRKICLNSGLCTHHDPPCMNR